MIVLAVAGAASAGAVCRYLVDLAVSQRRASVFPWGTLVVNVTGSLALGFVVGLGIYHGIGDTFRTGVGTGFLGDTPPSRPSATRPSGCWRRACPAPRCSTPPRA